MLAISFQNLIPQTSDFGQSNKSVYSIRHGPPSSSSVKNKCPGLKHHSKSVENKKKLVCIIQIMFQ